MRFLRSSGGKQLRAALMLPLMSRELALLSGATILWRGAQRQEEPAEADVSELAADCASVVADFRQLGDCELNNAMAMLTLLLA